jgi:hypothetical protein
MLKEDRDKARELAAIADSYIASGGQPKILPPAGAGDEATMRVETAMRSAGAAGRGRTRETAPERPRLAPLLLCAALCGIGLAIAFRASHGRAA